MFPYAHPEGEMVFNSCLFFSLVTFGRPIVFSSSLVLSVLLHKFVSVRVYPHG